MNLIDPLGDGLSAVTLKKHIGSDLDIVETARVSTGADTPPEMGERERKLIRYLLRHQHGSPFEHNLLTFRIVCPVFVDRHLVKYRAGVSKNEASGRYQELEEEFFTPLVWRAQAPSNRQASVEAEQPPEWHAYNRDLLAETYQHIWTTYRELLARGVAREQARMVLPLGLYVSSYYTFNLRSLLHLIAQRDADGAQHETRLYARALAELSEPLFPVTFGEWRALRGEG